VIMMTAYGKFEHAVEATKAGCFSFVASRSSSTISSWW